MYIYYICMYNLYMYFTVYNSIEHIIDYRVSIEYMKLRDTELLHTT